MNPVIAELDPADINKACQLFKNVFGQTVTATAWYWKYAHGPRLGAVNLVARSTDGELLGHAGASVFAGTAGGEPLSMAQVCDVMVLDSARGGLAADNVYPRLIKALQQTLSMRFTSPYAYGFAGVRPFKLGARMGFYRELQRCRPGYFVEPAKRTFDGKLWRAREIPWDLSRLDRIWLRRASGLTRPTVLRTAAYLAWRYRDHPSNSYRLWVLTHLMRDRGWLITRTLPDGEICVVDSLIPEAADPTRLVAALATAIASSSSAVPPIHAWFLPSDPSQGVPIMGSQVLVDRWHTEELMPRFQPGDTDVY